MVFNLDFEGSVRTLPSRQKGRDMLFASCFFTVMIRTTEKFGESAGQGHLTLPRGLGVGSLRNTREARPEGRGEAGQAE